MKDKQPFKKVYPQRIKRISNKDLEDELFSIDELLMKGAAEKARGQNPYATTDNTGNTKQKYDMKKLRYMKTTVLKEMKERINNARTNNNKRR